MPRLSAELPPIRSALVMGLGRHGGGVAAARFLASQGVAVTVSDSASASSLAESIASLQDLQNVRFKLGGHDEADFRQAECVVVNPAVRLDHPCLRIARQHGARITSEIELFAERCPARMIGVTGSSGKSSTATMLAAILAAAGCRAWLGGNIGISLLPKLGEIGPDDWVVLELSSFQLAHLSEQFPRLQIAVITNCAPNHLDWHRDYADYQAAKQRLIAGQIAAEVVVLNPNEASTASWSELATGEVVAPWPLDAFGELRVTGVHQRTNAALAVAAAEVALRNFNRAVDRAGLDRQTIDRALVTFTGLAHRLERLPDVAGRRVYNDSKATTPEATVAAVRAVGRAWLLLGGYDKGADFNAMCIEVVGCSRGVAVFGAVRETLRRLLLAIDPHFMVHSAETMREALEWTFAQSQPGEAIVLSPGCASLDQYRDYVARGEEFARLIAQCAERT